MAEKRDDCSARNIIKYLRCIGHSYLELREGEGESYVKLHGDGDCDVVFPGKIIKQSIYFCVLCDESCSSKISLAGHLFGSAHKKKLDIARDTLLGRNNMWLFWTDLFFSDTSREHRPDSEFSLLEKSMLNIIGNCKTFDIEEFGCEEVADRLIPRIFHADIQIPFHNRVEKIGLAKISLREGVESSNLSRMWCEWLGKESLDQLGGLKVEDCNIGVIVLPYNLGWEGPEAEMETKNCGICDQKMIPGKDVALLLCLHSRKIFCSLWKYKQERVNRSDQPSLNSDVVFQQLPQDPNREFHHVFHTGCLIHWILWCEYVIWTGIEATQTENINRIYSVFCPDCDSTSCTKHYSDSQMSIVKSKILKAHHEWTKSPEDLPNCSIGFHFPQSEESKEEIIAIKLLEFYRAEYDSGGNNKLMDDDQQSGDSGDQQSGDS